jgi:Methyltransferase domain
MDSTESVWDAEYQAGRYENEPPVPFVEDILAAAREFGLTGRAGLYIGCGNGRNYVPLVAAGLDLVGLDVSRVAVQRLAERLPGHPRLVHGDLSVLPADATYGTVIGIQVFQHGDRSQAHSHVRAAQERVAPGGLFCIRVNASDTDVWPRHECIERCSDRGYTVRYLEGPKKGLAIHFFSGIELSDLFSSAFDVVLPLRCDVTWREPRHNGQWSQWEGIWRRRATATDI